MKMKLELKLVFPAAGIRHVQFVSVPPPSLVNRQSKFFLGGFMAFEQNACIPPPRKKAPRERDKTSRELENVFDVRNLTSHLLLLNFGDKTQQLIENL